MLASDVGFIGKDQPVILGSIDVKFFEKYAGISADSIQFNYAVSNLAFAVVKNNLRTEFVGFIQFEDFGCFGNWYGSRFFQSDFRNFHCTARTVGNIKPQLNDLAAFFPTGKIFGLDFHSVPFAIADHRRQAPRSSIRKFFSSVIKVKLSAFFNSGSTIGIYQSIKFFRININFKVEHIGVKLDVVEFDHPVFNFALGVVKHRPAVKVVIFVPHHTVGRQTAPE